MMGYREGVKVGGGNEEGRKRMRERERERERRGSSLVAFLIKVLIPS